jgi:hypothetical protein
MGYRVFRGRVYRTWDILAVGFPGLVPLWREDCKGDNVSQLVGNTDLHPLAAAVPGHIECTSSENHPRGAKVIVIYADILPAHSSADTGAKGLGYSLLSSKTFSQQSLRLRAAAVLLYFGRGQNALYKFLTEPPGHLFDPANLQDVSAH